jgi:hypothetical protein
MRKRRILAAALAAVAAFGGGACKQARKTPAPAVQEAPGRPKLLASIRMGDPAAESQLLSGFYTVEDNAWRWTGKDFSVALRPPAGAGQQGAALKFTFTIPQPSIAKLKSVTVSASVNGTALPPETYSQAGQFEYKRDVAPALLAGSPVKVDFHLDKAVPPGGGDLRELGVVALSVGLEPK